MISESEARNETPFRFCPHPPAHAGACILVSHPLRGAGVLARARDGCADQNHLPTFTTIDVPGAGVTGISAINKVGDMVGSFGQSNSGPISGFLYRSGTFTYFDYPGETV